MVQTVLEQNPRCSLAEMVAGKAERWPVTSVLSGGEWLDCARQEGVVTLVDKRLRDGLADVPESVRLLFAEAAREDTVRMMVRQSEARRVLGKLAAAELPVLLLKGSALAYWAYPEPHLRQCADVDMLFATRDAAAAAAALLAEDGYIVRQHYGDSASREFLCVRQRTGAPRVELDMHWGLSGKPVFADRLRFDELMAGSIALPALAPSARGLGPVHACLHACLHRLSDLANGGRDQLRWLYDLHLLALSLDADGWEALIALAGDRGLAGVCADGLGSASEVFFTPLPDRTMAALRSAGAAEALDPKRMRNWLYFQRQNLRALPTHRARLRWLWQRLFPTADYREDVGVDASGFARDRLRRALGRLRPKPGTRSR